MLTTFSGRRASQNEHELRNFIDLLHSESVKRYCEIGARHGDTFHQVMRKLPTESVGLAVDLPGGLWGAEASRPHLERAVADINRLGRAASLLFGDSQTDATRRLIVGRGPFDAILIDGDHTIEGVTRDWESYRDLAPLIAFHDIVGAGQIEKVGGRPVEVPLLWASIRESGRRVVEFVAPRSKMGIGVVWTR